jgi:hypothetical protein
MNPHAEEWDWPVERPPTRRRQRYYQTINVPSGGWSSPGVRKAVDIYWQVTITVIKMLLAIPLAIMAIGAFWLLAVIVSLVV